MSKLNPEEKKRRRKIYRKSEDPLKVKAQLLRRACRVLGLSAEDTSAALAKLETHPTCEICGRAEPGNRFTRLSIDHDHATGKFRGLLCHRCNKAIGLFGDDTSLLLAAVSYLTVRS